MAQLMSASVWQWLSNSGWVDYDAATAGKLEAALKGKQDKIDVDRERFVDLSLTVRDKLVYINLVWSGRTFKFT